MVVGAVIAGAAVLVVLVVGVPWKRGAIFVTVLTIQRGDVRRGGSEILVVDLAVAQRSRHSFCVESRGGEQQTKRYQATHEVNTKPRCPEGKGGRPWATTWSSS